MFLIHNRRIQFTKDTSTSDRTTWLPLLGDNCRRVQRHLHSTSTITNWESFYLVRPDFGLPHTELLSCCSRRPISRDLQSEKSRKKSSRRKRTNWLLTRDLSYPYSLSRYLIVLFPLHTILTLSLSNRFYSIPLPIDLGCKMIIEISTLRNRYTARTIKKQRTKRKSGREEEEKSLEMVGVFYQIVVVLNFHHQNALQTLSFRRFQAQTACRRTE